MWKVKAGTNQQIGNQKLKELFSHCNFFKEESKTPTWSVSLFLCFWWDLPQARKYSVKRTVVSPFSNVSTFLLPFLDNIFTFSLTFPGNFSIFLDFQKTSKMPISLEFFPDWKRSYHFPNCPDLLGTLNIFRWKKNPIFFGWPVASHRTLLQIPHGAAHSQMKTLVFLKCYKSTMPTHATCDTHFYQQIENCRKHSNPNREIQSSVITAIWYLAAFEDETAFFPLNVLGCSWTGRLYNAQVVISCFLKKKKDVCHSWKLKTGKHWCDFFFSFFPNNSRSWRHLLPERWLQTRFFPSFQLP